MNTKTVKSGEQITIRSETGEWLLNTYFTDKDMSNEWITRGYINNIGQIIGKFREMQYEKNKYSWMFLNNFELSYVNGVATFSKK